MEIEQEVLNIFKGFSFGRKYGKWTLNLKNIEKTIIKFEYNHDYQTYVQQNSSFFKSWIIRELSIKIKKEHINMLLKHLNNEQLQQGIVDNIFLNKDFLNTLTNLRIQESNQVQQSLILLYEQIIKFGSIQNLSLLDKNGRLKIFLETSMKQIKGLKMNSFKQKMILKQISSILVNLVSNEYYKEFISQFLKEFLENYDFLNFENSFILDTLTNKNFIKYYLDKQIKFDEKYPEQSLESSFNKNFYLGLTKFIKETKNPNIEYFYIYKSILPYLQYLKKENYQRKIIQIVHFELLYKLKNVQMNQDDLQIEKFLFNQDQFEDIYLFEYGQQNNLIEDQMFIRSFGLNKKNLNIIQQNLQNNIGANLQEMNSNLLKFKIKKSNSQGEIQIFQKTSKKKDIKKFLYELKECYHNKDLRELILCLKIVKSLNQNEDQEQYIDYLNELKKDKQIQSIIKHFTINSQEKFLQFQRIDDRIMEQVLNYFIKILKNKVMKQFLEFFFNFIEKFFQNNQTENKQYYQYIFRLIQIYGLFYDIIMIFIQFQRNNQQDQKNKEYNFFESSFQFFNNNQLYLEHYINNHKKFLSRYVSKFINIYAHYPKQLDFLKNFRKYNQDVNDFVEQVLKLKIQKFYINIKEIIQDNGSQNYLKLERENLFQKTMKYFKKTKPNKLRKKFGIQFKNDIGQDMGGLKREFFFLLGEQIFDQKQSFFNELINNENKSLYISDYFQVKQIGCYYFIGQFLAVSIIQKQTISARLQEVLLKMILNKQISFKDFKTFDQTFYNSFQYILNNEQIENLDLNFNIDYILNGKKYIKDLIKNGSTIKVTDVNKKDYIFRSIKFLILDKYKEAINQFLKGFHSIIPYDYLNDFTAEELGYLISGDQIVFASEIIDNITCSSGYTRSSQSIQLLFKYLKNLQSEGSKGQNMLRGFLQFVTGSGQVPYGGLRNLRDANGEYSKIEISKSQQGTDSLPTASTCFNNMKMPPYLTYKILKKKMDTSITFGKIGFALV